MSYPFTLPSKAIVHLDDAVTGIKALKFQTHKTLAVTADTTAEVSKAPEPPTNSNSVALSFAYDIVTKALNVVMTDKHSGEVVRQMSYTHLPSGMHQSDRLNGLLLDHLV
jgi:uncharacterized FlaG/YvyC family protein